MCSYQLGVTLPNVVAVGQIVWPYVGKSKIILPGRLFHQSGGAEYVRFPKSINCENFVQNCPQLFGPIDKKMSQQQVSHIPAVDGKDNEQSTDTDVGTKLCSLSLTCGGFHLSSIVADQRYEDSDTDANKNSDDYVQQ